MEGHRPEYFN